jgi:hypothetical protein
MVLPARDALLAFWTRLRWVSGAMILTVLICTVTLLQGRFMGLGRGDENK